MMKYAKCAAAVLTAGLGVSALAGCSQLSGNTSQSTGDAVYATFNGKDIPMDYVKFQLNEAQYEYEAMFSQYFGTTDFWSRDLSGNGSTMEETVINNVLTGIQQTAILNWYAEKNNITLTDEQQKKVADAVKSAMEQANSNPDYASAVGVTEDLIRQVYQENAIANAVYMQLVADVDTTVGDDEFIQKEGSLLEAVIDERGFEFAAEGDRRWTLIRTGLLNKKVKAVKDMTRAMIDGLKSNGYYQFPNGNVISNYVWTKAVDGKALYGYRLTTQTPKGKENDPVLYPGWRGQNDEWEAYGCNYKGKTNTNLAIKGLFNYIDPNGAEAKALEAEGYKKVNWGADIVKNEDEFYKYLF